jgi:hypothetical protein
MFVPVCCKQIPFVYINNKSVDTNFSAHDAILE